MIAANDLLSPRFEVLVRPCSRFGLAILLAASSPAWARPPASVDSAWEEGRLPATVYEGVPERGGTLVIRLDQEPPSLDKLTDTALAIDWMLERKVLESMAEPDATRHPEYPLKPALATSWTISPDQLTFTFHIRRDVLWHDGTPFSGKDVVATVRKILDPSVRAMHLRNNFVDLADISTAPGDDFTVIARFSKPYFLALRALATLQIYPAHLLETAGDMLHSKVHRAPVGTGPFRFEEWKTGDRIGRAQGAGRQPDPCNPWIGLILAFVLGLHSLYYQICLNSLWASYGTPPEGTEVQLRA